MIKILLLLPNPSDGTSYYRGMGVFGELRKTYPELSFEVVLSQDMLDWSTVMQFDIFFMQRPFSNVHVANSVLIKKMRKPLIMDYDDNFFAIPEDNVFFKVYNDEQTRKNIFFLINNANSVWVSTEYLKQEFIRICNASPKKLTVIPNAFNDSLFDFSEAEFCKRPQVSVMWRGGNTHFEDLSHYRYAICEEISHVPFTFYGQKPDFPHEISYIHQPFKHVMDYFEILQCRQHQILIVPLVDNRFNRAKSNCAWLEATYAGAVVLAPDWGEWKMPGVYNYHSPESFHVKLKKMISGKYSLHDSFELSKWHIQEKLLLSEVNDLRAEIVEQLAG